ncbi:MAG TPA: ATP-binding protein [Candidatus Wallbacteria bacterium]|nr:ATP-binding protein [Candidatus Wallbacteria bacterium]
MPLYKADLKVEHDAISFRAVQRFFDSLCSDLAVPAREKLDMELAIEEGVMYLLEAASGTDAACQPIDISMEFDNSSITITMLSPCRPFDHGSLPQYDPGSAAADEAESSARGLGSFLMFKKLDSVQWRYIEKTGMQLSMHKMLPAAVRERGPKGPARPESAADFSGALSIRRLKTEKEALAVSICAYDVYKYAYKDVVYYPAQLLEDNLSGKMLSMIAIDEAGKVIGHYALVKNAPQDRIGELGAAFVRPEFRKHNIFMQLCDAMHESFDGLGLDGVFSLSVTSHASTQKHSERTGRKTTGIRLASAPAVFVEGAKPGERVTSVVNYRQLSRRPIKTIYIPGRYKDMVLSAYGDIGVDIRQGLAGEEPAGSVLQGVSCKNDFVWKRSSIEVYGGPNSQGKLQAYFELALEQKMASIVLAVDLENPDAPQIVECAAGLGFFYSGVMPECLKGGRDALHMQYLNGETVDASKMILYTDSAKRIMDFIMREAPHAFKNGEPR